MTPSGQTICLCMIVKDEAPVIRRCLDSVRPLVDRWLIVDTGSTDGTQAIVREHFRDVPGELVERPWRDFAFNRSEALALARERGDYSLIIDADDALVIPEGFALPPLDADSYTVDIDFSGVRYTRPQFVKAALGWRYEGVIHEYLACEAARTTGHLPLVLRIHQDGARRRDPDTYKKDAAVLERAVAEETDPLKLSRYTFYLAQSYRDSGQTEKSVALYLERAGMGFWDQEVFCSLLYAGRQMQALGRDPEEVLAVYRRATAACPTRAEALHAAARLCRGLSRFADGRVFAQGAAGLAQPPAGLFVEAWIYDFGALDEWAVNAYWAGHYRDCLDATLKALQRGKVPPSEMGRCLDNMRFALDKMPGEAVAPEPVNSEKRLLHSASHEPSEPVVGEVSFSQCLPALPCTLNIGAKETAHEDQLTIDCDAASNPDIILDLSAVTLQPKGIRIQTLRFGDTVLKYGLFNLIIANNFLQKIKNIDILMTNMLNLLCIDGKLEIEVPYDLSSQVWELQSHRHTFNERSWSRYTDPAPDLGWCNARLVLECMDYRLSPLGLKLRSDKVSISSIKRIPSAVDTLFVAFRKV